MNVTHDKRCLSALGLYVQSDWASSRGVCCCCSAHLMINVGGRISEANSEDGKLRPKSTCCVITHNWCLQMELHSGSASSGTKVGERTANCDAGQNEHHFSYCSCWLINS